MNSHKVAKQVATIDIARTSFWLRGNLFGHRQCLRLYLIGLCGYMVGLLPFGVLGQATTGIEGNLTVAYFQSGSWQSNHCRFVLHVAHPSWRLVLTCDGSQEEVYCDGHETFWLARYSENTQGGTLNSSMIKVFSGSRIFDARAAEHVWIALLSRDFFLDKVIPIIDAGLCLNESGIITEARISPGDASPRSLRWHNQRADTVRDATRIVGEFEWGGPTNFGNASLLLPQNSRLAMQLVFPDGKIQPASFSQLEITRTELNDSNLVTRPKIAGRSLVQDFRNSDGPNRRSIQYDIHDGKIPLAGSSFVREVQKLSTPPFTAKSNARRSIVIWVGFGLLSTAFVIFAQLHKQKNKNEERNENQ